MVSENIFPMVITVSSTLKRSSWCSRCNPLWKTHPFMKTKQAREDPLVSCCIDRYYWVSLFHCWNSIVKRKVWLGKHLRTLLFFFFFFYNTIRSVCRRRNPQCFHYFCPRPIKRPPFVLFLPSMQYLSCPVSSVLPESRTRRQWGWITRSQNAFSVCQGKLGWPL